MVMNMSGLLSKNLVRHYLRRASSTTTTTPTSAAGVNYPANILILLSTRVTALLSTFPNSSTLMTNSSIPMVVSTGKSFSSSTSSGLTVTSSFSQKAPFLSAAADHRSFSINTRFSPLNVRSYRSSPHLTISYSFSYSYQPSFTILSSVSLFLPLPPPAHYLQPKKWKAGKLKRLGLRKMERVYKCLEPGCEDKGFRSSKQLQCHYEGHHRDVLDELVYQCRCGARTRDLESLVEHKNGGKCPLHGGKGGKILKKR